MIKPTRHTNPDYSVINISAYIIKLLKAQYSIEYDKLLGKVCNELGEKAKENYPYALNFLFLLDKIKYLEKTDTFIFNEAK
ncbi:hypothetical protein SAMN05444671_2114 [Flavobacterium sp. CF108]|jgi:hypothetical protein|uniref:ABC-three component system middle component 8 n=1 Tax=unclassified Flavobacterium TaxID=196869 RepID=UPI0008C97768|nr:MULTISPECIES: ABC-three component system middle component 8 [unclassified Flavobacterium]SEN69349.1 hypothetical protein SAMN04487978_1430 [Flavobacterium sp. fv08]SHH08752.1 hypothetical protein SAMN05444671_2114 [Flavobacterium sp. CF108]